MSAGREGRAGRRDGVASETGDVAGETGEAGEADWERALGREFAAAAFFDEGIEAARNACVAGASIASAAVTAAAYYDNPLTGVGALRACMARLEAAPLEFDAFRAALAAGPPPDAPGPAFAPGFGFVAPAQAAAVAAAADRLLGAAAARPLGRFFVRARARLEPFTGPLNPAGLAAIAFLERGASPEQAERRFLLWRVEAAIAEAQKTRRAGLAAFPFLSEGYVYEGPRPPARAFDVAELRRRVGLD